MLLIVVNEETLPEAGLEIGMAGLVNCLYCVMWSRIEKISESLAGESCCLPLIKRALDHRPGSHFKKGTELGTPAF